MGKVRPGREDHRRVGMKDGSFRCAFDANSPQHRSPSTPRDADVTDGQVDEAGPQGFHRGFHQLGY